MSIVGNDNGSTPHVRDLFVYPMKGVGGVRVDRVELDDFGPRHDRRWMAVNANGVFVSQRELPAMSRIRAVRDGDALVLSAPGCSTLRVPVPPANGARREVRVWRDTVAAVDGGSEAARWLTTLLGRPLSLVYMPDDAGRPVDSAYGRPGDRVSFADGFPLLIIPQAALDDLNRRLDVPLPMNRFRPSLVVDGVPAHAEDGWNRIAIRNVELEIVKPCARCAVTTVDQETGVRGVEPLRTLAVYRRAGSKVLFGQNAIHRGRGELRIGDAVRILA